MTVVATVISDVNNNLPAFSSYLGFFPPPTNAIILVLNNISALATLPTASVSN
jgi:hypothetical protein